MSMSIFFKILYLRLGLSLKFVTSVKFCDIFKKNFVLWTCRNLGFNSMFFRLNHLYPSKKNLLFKSILFVFYARIIVCLVQHCVSTKTRWWSRTCLLPSSALFVVIVSPCVMKNNTDGVWQQKNILSLEVTD